LDIIKINILGSTWSIKYSNEDIDPFLKDVSGYADSSSKEIIIDTLLDINEAGSKKDLLKYRNQVLRHEIVHAFLAESGLDGCGHGCDHWEFNEEMVDWIAIQSPKIFAVYKDLGCL
jgi:hypothetical protein